LAVKSYYAFTAVKEMKHTSSRCCDKTVGGKMALHREWCFPNCAKSWWKTLL